MGLKFYVGEMQAQANDASRMNQEASQAISSLEKSIAQFLLAPLSGQAYDSAKRYFNVVYTPICRSVTMTGEAMANAHKRLISEYQSSVASIDIDEDQIMSQINRFEQLKQNLEHQMRVSKDVRPSLERRYINACECIAKKREQLEKFHAYNARSASFFSEYEACEQELARGIAQISGCKAWNAASGTFDIGKLDMTWATSINDRWGKREEELENKRAKNFAEGMKGRQYCRVQLATGAYVWMWVTDPTKVSQADFQFNQKYKDYLAILMKPENNLVDDYFKIMAEELRTGINQKTGKPLTDLEKAQRWSAVASAIAVLAVAAHYGAKGFTGKGAKPSKGPVLKGSNPKIVEEIVNPVIEAPRSGSGLKMDDIKPVKGKGSIYDIDPLTGKPPTKQTQIIVDEFPNVPKAHGFSDIIDNYAGLAEVTDLGNAKLYQIQGSQNGVRGRFEWIIQDGKVTHRMFVRNPELNGVPIK